MKKSLLAGCSMSKPIARTHAHRSAHRTLGRRNARTIEELWRHVAKTDLFDGLSTELETGCMTRLNDRDLSRHNRTGNVSRHRFEFTQKPVDRFCRKIDACMYTDHLVVTLQMLPHQLRLDARVFRTRKHGKLRRFQKSDLAVEKKLFRFPLQPAERLSKLQKIID